MSLNEQLGFVDIAVLPELMKWGVVHWLAP